MPDLNQLLLFCGASFLLAITPGPDILYVLARGLGQGRKAGMYAAMGFSLGCINHTLLAVLGLSAILAASATAFTVVKYCGAAYLIYIGIKTLRAGSAEAGEGDAKVLSPMAIFRQSVLANLLNPKVAIFFLAFLPQFVQPDKGSPALQMGIFGVIFMACAFVAFSAVALFSGAIGQRLRRNPKAGLWLQRASGGVLVGLGLHLAWSESI